MQPAITDWVASRARCSPVKVFQLIKTQVQSDVEQRNEQRGSAARISYQFSVVSGKNDRSFTFAPRGDVADRQVIFSLKENGNIAVYDDTDSNLMFETTPVFNIEKGECRLGIKERDGEGMREREYDFWQVRFKALEKLFFEAVRTEQRSF